MSALLPLSTSRSSTGNLCYRPGLPAATQALALRYSPRWPLQRLYTKAHSCTDVVFEALQHPTFLPAGTTSIDRLKLDFTYMSERLSSALIQIRPSLHILIRTRTRSISWVSTFSNTVPYSASGKEQSFAPRCHRHLVPVRKFF